MEARVLYARMAILLKLKLKTILQLVKSAITQWIIHQTTLLPEKYILTKKWALNQTCTSGWGASTVTRKKYTSVLKTNKSSLKKRLNAITAGMKLLLREGMLNRNSTSTLKIHKSATTRSIYQEQLLLL